MSDLAAALRSGEPLVGSWLSVGHPSVAEAVAGADLDFVVVDTEHAPTSLETVENVLRGVEAAPGDTTALARVPWNDPVRVKRLLDTGPAGVVVPMVESAAEAREAVAATRYPPEGVRGIAASRASDYTRSFEEYVARANEDLLTVVQIETGAGAEAAEDVAAVDGVDALFVGPADLSASLGTFPDQRDDRVVDAVEQVVAAGEDAGVPVGTLAVDPKEVDFWLDRGMDFLVVGVDVAMLAAGADEAAAAFRDAVDR
jgi:2-keto-3-deoxy-L-rhamnonate aldolase RhmA